MVAGAAAIAALLLVISALAACAPPRPRTVGHVFVINLENKGFDETFGPGSPAPYLTRSLRPLGAQLSQYYGVAHESLGNYIAQISGQGPNPQTQADCQLYTDFVRVGGTAPQQAVGQGCVYPPDVQTVAGQLDAKGLSWKGYMEDMGNSPTDARTCRHPELNGRDETQSAKPGDQYAARHNPFVYFHSIIDSPACAERVVPLDELDADLADVSTTPNLSYITPNLCNDGHDAPCADGRPGGLLSADLWLGEWVPKILASPAFRQDGLLVVTFDESEGDDASACCGEGPAPNSPLPGITGMGGGRVGAVLVSPLIRAGTSSATPYNHYSLLCSIEEIFGLPKLGYAARSELPCFGTDVYTARG